MLQSASSDALEHTLLERTLHAGTHAGHVGAVSRVRAQVPYVREQRVFVGGWGRKEGRNAASKQARKQVSMRRDWAQGQQCGGAGDCGLEAVQRVHPSAYAQDGHIGPTEEHEECVPRRDATALPPQARQAHGPVRAVSSSTLPKP